MELAAIDHNCHFFRNPSLAKGEKIKYQKTYNKRSKNYKVTTVLEEKGYLFWKTLACRILDKRVVDTETVYVKLMFQTITERKYTSQLKICCHDLKNHEPRTNNNKMLAVYKTYNV